LWIEPDASRHAIEASARTRAAWRSRVDEDVARPDQAALDQHAEGDARLGALARGDLEGVRRMRSVADQRAAGDLGIVGVALDADEAPAERLATAPVVPVPKNGSSTTSPGVAWWRA
jgi:hypothetical protein